MTTHIMGSESAECVAIQSDGRIVVAGNSAPAGFGSSIAVVRYRPNGTLDTGFGGSGKVTTLGGNARSVAVQKDGKIVIAGDWYTNMAGTAVVRYHTNGGLDTSFASTGSALTQLGGVARAMTIQDDGKIVTAGFASTAGDYDFSLMRFTPSGNFDTDFGGTGRVTTAVGDGYDICLGVALQSDGRIVAVGASYKGNNSDFAVVRYNTNGSLDTSFGGTGKVTTPIGNADDEGHSVAIQNNGKIVVGGWSRPDFALVRYNTDGSLDTSFGGTGKVTTSIGGIADDIRSIAIQADGRIVAAGRTWINNNNDIALARYNPNGSLDPAFGVLGKVVTTIGSSSEEGFGVAVQNDGKIIVAGYADNGTDSDFATLRYLGGGAEPEISVFESPGGIELADGMSNTDFGPVPSGTGSSKAFLIRNTGAGDLTDLSLTLTAEGSPGDFTIGALDPTTLAPGAEVTFTVSFSPTAAGTRTATLQIASNDLDENPFEINLTGTQATASEAWRLTYFGSPYNSGAGADMNDAEADGIVNLLEFATVSDPLAPTPSIGQLAQNVDTLEFTYSRPKAALEELNYELEASVSLTGSWNKSGMTTTILSDDGVIQQVRVTTSAGALGKRFVRLRVTRM